MSVFVNQRSGRDLIQRQIKRGAVFALAFLLGACSGITQPYVTSRGPVDDTSPPAGLTFAQAQVVARNASEDFHSRLQDLETFDLASGTLLVGAGLAGVAFGLYDAHIDAVYGAALVGGTAAAGRSFFPISTRKKTYLAGSNAISCAIVSIGLGEPDGSGAPVSSSGAVRSVPGAGGLVSSRGSLGSAADELRRLTLGSGTRGSSSVAPSGLGTGTSSLRAKSAQIMATARASGNSGASVSGIFSAVRTQKLASSVSDSQRTSTQLSNQIDSAIDTRGKRLLAATEAIIAAVNKQIEEAAITPETSLETALKNVTSINKSIKDTADSLIDEAEDTKDDAEAAEETATLAASMNTGNAQFSAAVNDTLGDIKEAKVKAEAQRTQAQYILSLVGTSDSCLEGLK